MDDHVEPSLIGERETENSILSPESADPLLPQNLTTVSCYPKWPEENPPPKLRVVSFP